MKNVKNVSISKELKLLNEQLNNNIKLSDKEIKNNDGTINFRKSDMNSEYFLNKLKTYRIILTGEFNSDFTRIKLFDREFINKEDRPKTCCKKDKYDPLNYSYNHILDSDNKILSLKGLDIDWPSSDHIPVYGELEI
jgi:hypothetical protein